MGGGRAERAAKVARFASIGEFGGGDCGVEAKAARAARVARVGEGGGECWVAISVVIRAHSEIRETLRAHEGGIPRCSYLRVQEYLVAVCFCTMEGTLWKRLHKLTHLD